MFRVIVYDTNECKTIHKSEQIFNGYNGACLEMFNVTQHFNLITMGDISDLEFSIIEVSPVTYSSLIHSLSEYNEDICPVYTLKNMTVDECFSHYEADLQDESWNDFARIEVYKQVMLELKELKEKS